MTEVLAKAPAALGSLYADLDARLLSLGDDVTVTTRKLHFAYRRIKNFACVEVHPREATFLVFVKVNPDGIDLVEGFTSYVRTSGHFGTGDLEIRIRSSQDLEKACP